MVEKTSAYNHQSVGSVEHMVQTTKQLMTKNADNTWPAILIFKPQTSQGIIRVPVKF